MSLIPRDVRDLEFTTLYTRGWKEISTSAYCPDRATCECLGSGKCSAEWFHHYMVKAETETIVEIDLSDCVSESAETIGTWSSFGWFDDEEDLCSADGVLVCADRELSVEEIPMSRSVLGSSYEYTLTTIAEDPASFTMLSFCDGTKKSPFINMHAELTALPNSDLVAGDKGSVVMGSWENLSLVMRLGSSTIDLVVSLLQQSELSVYLDENNGTPISIGSSPCCTCPQGGPQSLFVEPGNISAGATTRISITASIITKPISRYGGSYPSYRVLFLIVHNVRPGFLCTEGL